MGDQDDIENGECDVCEFCYGEVFFENDDVDDGCDDEVYGFEG